jgi:hypothetical protein
MLAEPLGAALAACHQHHGGDRVEGRSPDAMSGSYLGPEYSQKDVETRLRAAGARFEVLPEDEAMIRVTADALAAGQAVGWFQGRMEFGPRALGARSILGDARSPAMQKTLNLKVKYRESFRPFAPSVLREDVADWFELDDDSPYMLLVAGVREEHRRAMTDSEQQLFGIDKLNVVRSDHPGCDARGLLGSRADVHRGTNPLYYRLIDAFRRDGCPVLVNTSFNVRGEPIVCTPEDAFPLFHGNRPRPAGRSGRAVLRKDQQDPSLQQNYARSFAPGLSDGQITAVAHRDNLVMFVALAEAAAVGGIFFSTGRSSITAERAVPAALPETGRGELSADVLHPYFGPIHRPGVRPETNNIGFGSKQAFPFARTGDRQFLVGIFGGSVARAFCDRGTPRLIAVLQRDQAPCRPRDRSAVFQPRGIQAAATVNRPGLLSVARPAVRPGHQRRRLQRGRARLAERRAGPRHLDAEPDTHQSAPESDRSGHVDAGAHPGAGAHQRV